MSEMMPSIEIEKKPYEIKEIAPLGVGNPDSYISYKKRVESGELPIEAVEAAVEFILSGEGIRPIVEDDDGCIDGRCAGRVSYPGENGEFVRKVPIDDPSDHLRAKVAGGGYITSLAMRIGRGKASRSVTADLQDTIRQLAVQGIYCGAHIGEHGHDDTTDCGANDKFSLILENNIHYQGAIRAYTENLIKEAGLEPDSTVLDEVASNWMRSLSQGYGKDSTGAERMALIEDELQNIQQEAVNKEKPLAVTKDLKGDHGEIFTIINYLEGKTFSQAALNEFLSEHFPGVVIHAFVVDVPRIVKLAQAQAENEQEFSEALYAGTEFQLATKATLTDGSPRTFIFK